MNFKQVLEKHLYSSFNWGHLLWIFKRHYAEFSDNYPTIVLLLFILILHTVKTDLFIRVRLFTHTVYYLFNKV